MSYKDRHALETLPDRIAALAATIGALQSELADPDLYARDPGRFTAISAALTRAEAAHAAAEEQWLALEIQREEMEGR